MGQTPERLRRALADLLVFEGKIAHMYQDSRGFVTTGIGHLIKTPEAAIRLPFQRVDPAFVGPPPAATVAQIRGAWQRVKTMRAGMSADRYRLTISIELASDTIDQLAIARLETEFFPGLEKLFPEFDGYPEPAQRALIDIAYNAGIGRDARGTPGTIDYVPANGLRGFSNLRAAVMVRDWSAAAGRCRRKTSRDERNEWTARQFREAAQVEADRVS